MAKHSFSPKYPSVSVLLPENAKRPIISADITQEDWAYFMYRWDTYKKVTCMQEGSVVRELIKCCSKQVHKVYHRGFSSNRKVEVTEESALSKLEEISVFSRVKKMPAQSKLVSQQHAANTQPSTEDRLHPQFNLPDPQNHHNSYENQNLDKVIFNQIPNAKEVYSNKERIGATHPGSQKRGKSKKSKKVRLPTHDKGKIAKSMALLVMTLLTGSAILSSLPSDQAQVSHAQVSAVSHGKLIMGHHVYHKSRGWLKQAARVKPMVKLYSRLDMAAYKALGLKPPAKQATVSAGEHLADTGASICLGGRSYLRSLG